MKTYRGTVIATYFQEVTVEANSPEEAAEMMCTQFNIGDATFGGVDPYDMEEEA